MSRLLGSCTQMVSEPWENGVTIRGYVLIQADRRRAGDVIQEALAVPGVVTCEFLGGPYDAIAVVEAAGLDDLESIVDARIQRIDGVIRTLSCPIVDG
jgi:DNA-binding Lrp family transcriptional regulator